ncbi:hypothetical protein [Embleya sp. NPDC005575]|uniref:hypothetical protein n=1 Tax=Embleya sp. NPDC005575 TaxID=3156892 RepID=UPI00339E84D5
MSRSGLAGSLTSSMRTSWPRRAGTNSAIAARFSSRGPATSANGVPGDSVTGPSPVARSTRPSATARAAISWVRVLGTRQTSPWIPQLASSATNSWNCAARRIRTGSGPAGTACSWAGNAHGAEYGAATRPGAAVRQKSAKRHEAS